MKYLITLIGLITLINSSTAQTAPEKVAAAFCECSKQHDYAKHIEILKSNDKAAIRADFENIELIYRETKRCAKRSVKLTPEEGRKVPEDEIEAALGKNCPDVLFLGEQYRKISNEIDKEERIKDIDARLAIIDGFVKAKQKDSVAFYIADFISYYGRSEDFVFTLIESYYKVEDLENGNNEATGLISCISNEDFFYDTRVDKSVPLKEYVKTRIIQLAKKYKQQKIVDLANSKL